MFNLYAVEEMCPKESRMKSILQRLASFKFVSLVLISSPALSQGIVTGNDYAPYADEKLLNGGFATDIVINVLKTMKDDSKIRFLPWKRGFDQTIDNTYLGTFPYVKLAERELIAKYSEPLYYSASKIWYIKENPVNYSDYNSLAGKTFCNPQGYFITSQMRTLIDNKKVKLQDPTTMETCLKFLTLGRADFVIGPKPLMQEEGLKAGVWDKLSGSEKNYQEDAYYLIVGKTNPLADEFLKKFNKALNEFRSSAKFAELLKQHNLDGAVR